ncbi:hypothetical protein [Nocardia sp. XZ_19_369]|uniref:hypothetical protein n=1 Tax=Nocardia sp. XZ_19_369 TaxID=2769487 RepID=UPI00188FF2CF|nr:hypothetical protein [Nocardia sp. XZ_19_369]
MDSTIPAFFGCLTSIKSLTFTGNSGRVALRLARSRICDATDILLAQVRAIWQELIAIAQAMKYGCAQRDACLNSPYVPLSRLLFGVHEVEEPSHRVGIIQGNVQIGDELLDTTSRTAPLPARTMPSP